MNKALILLLQAARGLTIAQVYEIVRLVQSLVSGDVEKAQTALEHAQRLRFDAHNRGRGIIG